MLSRAAFKFKLYYFCSYFIAKRFVVLDKNHSRLKVFYKVLYLQARVYVKEIQRLVPGFARLLKTIFMLLEFNYRSSTNAFLGQKLEHLPHLIHFSWSIVGASKLFCDNAPTGQTFTAGHAWF